MNSLNINDQKDAGDEFGYLCVDDFIKTVIDARSLATAFELRLIDYLEQNGEVSAGTLMGQSKGDSRAVRLLLDLLRLNNILEENEGRIKLTRQFKRRYGTGIF